MLKIKQTDGDKMNKEIPEFLIEMSKRMNTDDNRCTAHPIWQVRCKRDVPTSADFSSGRYALYDPDGECEFYHSITSDEDDCRGYLIENYEEWCCIWAKDYMSEDYGSLTECFVDYFKVGERMDLPSGIDLIYMQEVEEVVSTHLTEADANWFIKRKQHDYPKLYTWVASAYWSPELKQLQDWIKSLTSED